jgi:hypothetical protein
VNLDPGWLMLSLVPSGIGFVLFTYGRKQVRLPQLVAGLALMVYPYFTGTMATLTSVGVLIGAALYVALQLGW